MRALWSASVAVLVLSSGVAAAIQPGQPARSDVCGSCHRDIYRMWKSSAHSRSLDDMAFLEAYRETSEREGAEVSQVCLGCHAPIIQVTRDAKLRDKTTWDGVSCEVCHGIVSVDSSRSGPQLHLDVGPVKRGPLKDAVSTGHEVAFSELHTGALACAPCHEYVSREGVPLMSTYSEWKDSQAARTGRTCQACHMGQTSLNVVDPKIKRVQVPVNLHSIPGGHSLDQLNKALSVSIRPRREKDDVVVEVAVTNKGAGHCVPTGMPGRMVVLSVAVRDGTGGEQRQSRKYAREFRDASGDAITSGSGFFARGVRAGTDSRLTPGEQRVETFRFPSAGRGSASIDVELAYDHSPREGPEDRTHIVFFHEVRTVAPAS